MALESGLDVIRKYDRQVPRYTSYPPAPYFTQDPDEARVTDLIVQSNRVGPRNASLYFHVPFCPKRCLFCGCHTEIGRPGSIIRRYMEALEKELDILTHLMDRNRPVSQGIAQGDVRHRCLDVEGLSSDWKNGYLEASFCRPGPLDCRRVGRGRRRLGPAYRKRALRLPGGGLGVRPHARQGPSGAATVLPGHIAQIPRRCRASICHPGTAIALRPRVRC
jgi:hypothetical protein